MTGGQLFSTEYESRVFAYDPDSWLAPFLDKCSGDDMCFAGRDFRTPYTIRIGDVCFTLIGQIVNRALVAARYQPTGFVMVNSPVETPSLAERVARDWAGTGADALKASLLADLHAKPHGPPPQGPKSEGDAQDEAAMLRSYVYPGALRRLRFYFPDAYAALSGEDLATKQAFEQDEAETARAYAKNAH